MCVCGVCVCVYTYKPNAGMEVKLPTDESRYFDYAWPPFCSTPRNLKWLGLSRHQVMYEHMQLYELNHGQSLSFFLSTLGSMTSARALVLINVDDKYKLNERFLPATPDGGPCIPTIVVTRKTGLELLEILRLYGREVQVQVHGGEGVMDGEGEGDEGEGREEDPSDEWDVIQSPRGM